MAFHTGCKRKRGTKRPFIVAAARKTLSIWFIIAGVVLFFFVCDLGILHDGEILTSMETTMLDFRRRSLSMADGYRGYASARPHPLALVALTPEDLPSNTASDIMTNTTRSDKVLDKIRRRKWSRELKENHQLKERRNHTRTLDFSMTDFSSYPVLPLSRILPDMTTDRGGVIFFLHVPKTGGQTIRHSFGLKQISRVAKRKINRERKENATLDMGLLLTPILLSKVHYITANRLDRFHQKVILRVKRVVSGFDNFGKILFVEVHGMDSLTALELEPYLHAWRARSKETNVPFFAFTILREAVSEQVSFFNFYYIHPGDTRFCGSITTSTRCRKRDNPTNGSQFEGGTPTVTEDSLLASTLSINAKIDLEAAMVKSIYDNPQCLFLARGERTFGTNSSHLRDDLDQQECRAAYESLQRTMDWIGRTETLTDETLPLLTKMMFNRSSIGRNLQKFNAAPQHRGIVVLSKIQDRIRKALEDSTQLDQDLYQRVVQHYRIEQWVNYKS